MSRRRAKGGRLYNSRLVSRLFLRYVLALAAYVAGYVGLAYLCWMLLSLVRWKAGDPIYEVLRWVKDNLVQVFILMGAAGWFAISIAFLGRPLRYLDEIVTAAERLSKPEPEPIKLSPPLAEAEAELNRVRERSLRDARLAREAEQRKNDMIVYLAHDLKTPLTSVIGYLTLLAEAPELPAERRAKYTGIALDKAQRLEGLINEFFDITRFSLTGLTLELETVHLSRMLEQLADEFQPILAEKGLTWRLDIASGLSIPGDADKLARVFDNLMRNAANYAAPGTAVDLRAIADGDAVQIELVNRGRTIPPEKLARLFEQFFRADDARSSGSGGAGLGLAIAKALVELHGGSIVAQSADGEIRFVIRLPMDRKKIT